jgi:hypothetical protein
MSMGVLFEVEARTPDPLIAVKPGQVVETELGKHGLGTAVFDPTRAFRFHLSRVWDPSGHRVNFVMLNPSTADAFVLDRTVRRCWGYALAWGMGSLAVTNCFALRSPDPKDLKRHECPVGPGADNDEAIVAAAAAADLVVAAWGAHAVYLNREAQVRRLLAEAGVDLTYLELTKAGHPGHPLYRSTELRPQPWDYLETSEHEGSAV